MKKTILMGLGIAAMLAACGPKKTTEGATSAGATSKVSTTATHEGTGLQPGRVDPANVPPETKIRASRGAKEGVVYQNALAAVYAPEDQKEFSAYDEYGWKNAGNYKTYGAFPAGWWVYSAPYWIVWDLKNGQRGE